VSNHAVRSDRRQQQSEHAEQAEDPGRYLDENNATPMRSRIVRTSRTGTPASISVADASKRVAYSR
jgi:hypothetical protein